MAPRRRRMRPIFNASEVCFLCGAIVPCYNMMTGKEKSQVVLEEDDLKFYREKVSLVDHLFVPSTVVEGACFSKFPKLSSFFYRAGKFFLSCSRYRHDTEINEFSDPILHDIRVLPYRDCFERMLR